MSPSGMHWRCLITSAANISRDHGAMVASDGTLTARYSSADPTYFAWADARHAAPDRLARLFIERFPEIVAAGRGRDWAYAGWYLEMLNVTYPAGLPIAYADYPLPEGALATINTGDRVVVPLPPPGEAGAERARGAAAPGPPDDEERARR